MPRPHVPNTGKLRAFQADGRRLLAWRFQQRDADAHLRHRVVERQGSEGLPEPTGGGREARSPQNRHGAGSVPSTGRKPGHGVLASERLDHLAAGRAVHARCVQAQRLPRGALSDGAGRVAGRSLVLGQLRREHVLHRVGEAHLRVEADELPRPCAGVQPATATAYRSVTANSVVAIATSRPAHCTASCACVRSEDDGRQHACRSRSSARSPRSICRR